MIFDRQIPMNSDLNIKNAFLFPIQNQIARKELLIGSLFFIIPPLGWIVNMGYRMNIVHHHHNEKSIWPGWVNWQLILKNGCIGALAFFIYMGLGIFIAALSCFFNFTTGVVIGSLLAGIGVFLIPGFMTFYCVNFDFREVFDIRNAIKRISLVRRRYLKAWGIVLISASLSLTGFLFFGVGFFVTTVWNWQVAAFCFCNAFKDLKIKEY